MTEPVLFIVRDTDHAFRMQRHFSTAEAVFAPVYGEIPGEGLFRAVFVQQTPGVEAGDRDEIAHFESWLLNFVRNRLIPSEMGGVTYL